MAGFVDKIKRMWDSPDDEYEYDDYSYEDNNKDSYDDEDPYEEQREHQREVRRSERSERRRYTSDSYTDSDSGNKVVNINASTKIQVILFKPERFGDETRGIADEINKNRTVVLNLEDTNKDMSRRIIDFLSGVTYAKKGKIKKIANATFIIMPENVDFTGDDLLGELENNDEKDILISRISDLYYLSMERNKPEFTSFLNESEISICIEALKDFGITDYYFFGGYENSQRKVLGFFAKEEEYPISIIEYKYRKQDKLTHRQFLGTILSTGLNRNVIGDIVCMEGKTYVFVLENQADYILSQINRIAKVGVKSKIVTLDNFDYTPTFKYHDYTVASLRLDAVVAAITGLSREKVRTLMLSGNVFKNYIEDTNISDKVSQDDIISIRKYGKFILDDINGLTKKGRQKIKIKQYI